MGGLPHGVGVRLLSHSCVGHSWDGSRELKETLGAQGVHQRLRELRPSSFFLLEAQLGITSGDPPGFTFRVWDLGFTVVCVRLWNDHGLPQVP